MVSDRLARLFALYYAPALGEGAFWNSAIRPSICPVAQLPACAISTLAACSLARDVRTADPSADGRRSGAIFDPRWPDWRRNDMPPSNSHRRGHIVSPPPGRYLVKQVFAVISQTAASQEADFSWGGIESIAVCIRTCGQHLSNIVVRCVVESVLCAICDFLSDSCKQIILSVDLSPTVPHCFAAIFIVKAEDDSDLI